MFYLIYKIRPFPVQFYTLFSQIHWNKCSSINLIDCHLSLIYKSSTLSKTINPKKLYRLKIE